VEKVLHGEENILWKAKPEYFAKTSGTTSGTKYIPITKNLFRIILTAREMHCSVMFMKLATQNFRWWINFLSGSPEMTEKAGIKTRRLSGNCQHHDAGYLRK